jgi:hypothetical protein
MRFGVMATGRTVMRMGRETGVPTPANAAVYAAFKPWRMGIKS